MAACSTEGSIFPSKHSCLPPPPPAAFSWNKGWGWKGDGPKTHLDRCTVTSPAQLGPRAWPQPHPAAQIPDHLSAS